MQKPPTFNVYNASAGSGKTFALVKEYLKLLFRSNNLTLFRNILALTFTNKAVGEMKSRIIDTLKEFSEPSILTTPNSMFLAISEELNLQPEIIHRASKKILHNILHNYAAFDISTIDRFTHKVIRTFAFDLKIPVNFEVELDTDTLLSEAVDSLISKAGSDKALTKILVDFAIEKADDDKSWDITLDFNKIAKLLVNENDIPFLELLKHKTLEDFKGLKKILKTKIATNEKTIIEKAQEALTLIDECGLEHNDFSGRNGYVPSYFLKLTNKDTTIMFDKVWMQNIETHPLYPKTTEPSIAVILDEIQPMIISCFNQTKQRVIEQKFLKNFYKNITPLSVLNAINAELKQIKDDKNILLISEFNKTIYNEIKDQPTPFIYERLGEKFKHYFIDEFQDTSQLQWENLIPLLDNSLSSETGSAMIVGDAKQAIYRWRGGKPELFMDLYHEKSIPFTVPQNVLSLDHNYRSCKSIVDFNNLFFEHLSTFAFENEAHALLYKAARQEHYLKEEGYVSLQFLELNEGDDKDILYPEAVKQTIETATSNGFELRDICVLVRKKSEGVAIADYLSTHDINIISSETLLINRSSEVQFINNVLKLSGQPDNKELKVETLYYLATALKEEDKHSFITAHLALNLKELSEAFKRYKIDFNFSILAKNPLYNAVEYIVQTFKLVETSDAYIQFYLDTVIDYSYKHTSNIMDFLDYWEKKKNSLSITMPDGKNAVQIMTIHKSKGLEFPVVIYPYADLNIYREKEPKVWYPINEEEFNGFSHILLNYNKDIADFDKDGETIYQHHQSELELDNINLLYVTLTRPIEQLYIISRKDVNAKGEEKLKEFSGLFINFLKEKGMWTETQLKYHFGNPKKEVVSQVVKDDTIEQEKFISNSGSDFIKIVTNSGLLWDTAQGAAIEKGNLIHNLMAKIETSKDVGFALSDALMQGTINVEQLEALNQTINSIINHEELAPFFSQDVTIYNERDIISAQGIILRPDRLVIDKNNKATVLDYKTGKFNPTHFQQLQAYQDVIETMNIKVERKILIYVNEDIEIKEF